MLLLYSTFEGMLPQKLVWELTSARTEEIEGWGYVREGVVGQRKADKLTAKQWESVILACHNLSCRTWQPPTISHQIIALNNSEGSLVPSLPLCLPLNAFPWHKVKPHAHWQSSWMQFDQTSLFDLTDCTAAVQGERLEGRMEGTAGCVVHSFQCFLAILHLSGWTNRLSELTSPWERPTASLIHNSLLFLYIPIISSCAVETLCQSCFCVPVSLIFTCSAL